MRFWSECTLLGLVAPALLFPTLRPTLTAASLALVLITWVGGWIIDGSPWPASPFNGALLIWCLMFAVGVVVTAFPELTLPKATGLILGIAIWRDFVLLVRTRRQWVWAVVGLIAVGAGFATLGCLSVQWPVKVPFLERALAFLPSAGLVLPGGAESGSHPNQLAGTVVFYIPFFFSLLLGWILEGPLKKPRFMVITLLWAVAAGILLLTQSRSGWIGALAGSLVLLMFWGSILPVSRQRCVLQGGLGVILVLGLLTAWWIGFENLATFWETPSEVTALGDLSSMEFRKEVWHWALAVIGDFPITGCGLGTFREVVRLLYPINVPVDYDIAHAHNIFLQTALDFGLLGLVSYLALLQIASSLGWQAARQDPFSRPIVLGILAGLVALHSYGLTDALALGSKTGVIFWVALGLLAALVNMRDGNLALIKKGLLFEG